MNRVGTRLGARVGVVLAAVVTVMSQGCASGQHARALGRAQQDLSSAIRRGDDTALASMVHPGVRPGASGTPEGPMTALGEPRWTVLSLNVTLDVGDGRPMPVQWADGGWRFDRDLSEVFPADTPRAALASFCLATELERWDVVLGLAPSTLRRGLDEAALARAWGPGPQGDALRAARDLLSKNLHGPLFEDGHTAALIIDGKRAAALLREGPRWVVVDF